MNAINVIAPYKYLDMWVFDDPRFGLVQEPFVSGTDTLIEHAVAAIPGAEAGFIMLFSAAAFPGCQIHLDWRRSDMGGNWYYESTLNLEAWLCPALYRYFDDAPRELFLQVRAKGRGA
ncbi:MAG TPA: DUF6717 family protein [Steroidobacteraceae bacterium]|jgi:hypothetical protein|nr:DUF6717 family protein [Steroidobacteraceae bacterium]